MSKTIQHYFNSDSTSLNLDEKVYLEDFYEVAEQPIDSLEELTLGISFDNGTPAETESIYTLAVQNLKKMAPNLKNVNFVGGYVYSPADNNPDSFRHELADLKAHFDSLSKIFKVQGLPVGDVRFNGMQTFEKYSINEAYHSDLIHELFGHKMSEEEIENSTAEFTYNPDGIPFQVKLQFNITNSIPRNNEEAKNRRRFSINNACGIEQC